MMKRIIFTGMALLTVMTGEAMAVCPGTRVISKTNVMAALQNATFCVGSVGNWQAQEFHKLTTSSGGRIEDWKLGASDPVDPTQDIGAWNVNFSLVTYNYTGDSNNYNYSLFDQGGGVYKFCTSDGNTEVVTAIKKTGQVDCNL